MTATIQAFAFDSHAVRVVMKNDEPWFVAKDVVACLELEWKGSDSIRGLDDDERGPLQVDSPYGNQEVIGINESGLYTLVLRCRDAVKPGTPAHTFRKWVTAEVLPSIRKTGAYIAPNATPVDAALEQVLIRVDRLCGVVEKLIETLPAILAAQRPKVRRPPIYEKDLPAILALRDRGATLPDIARATGFGQTSLYYVLEGKYAITAGGRVKRVADANDKVSALVRREGQAGQADGLVLVVPAGVQRD